MLAKLVSPPAAGTARASSMLSATGRSMKPWSVCQRSSPSPASPLAMPSSIRLEMMLISGKPGTVISAVRVCASGGSISPKRRARPMKSRSSIVRPRKRSTRCARRPCRIASKSSSPSRPRSAPATSAPSAAPQGLIRIVVAMVGSASLPAASGEPPRPAGSALRHPGARQRRPAEPRGQDATCARHCPGAMPAGSRTTIVSPPTRRGMPNVPSRTTKPGRGANPGAGTTRT